MDSAVHMRVARVFFVCEVVMWWVVGGAGDGKGGDGAWEGGMARASGATCHHVRFPCYDGG